MGGGGQKYRICLVGQEGVLKGGGGGEAEGGRGSRWRGNN